MSKILVFLNHLAFRYLVAIGSGKICIRKLVQIDLCWHNTKKEVTAITSVPFHGWGVHLVGLFLGTY